MRQYYYGEKFQKKRLFWWHLANILILCIFLTRTWYLQIYKGEYYQKLSEQNRIRKIQVPAPRGIIYDRWGHVVLDNRPFYDLVYIPQYVRDEDETLKAISSLLYEPLEDLRTRLNKGRGLPDVVPIKLMKNLTSYQRSVIQSVNIFLPGIDIVKEQRRNYTKDTPSHIVGYLREIGRKQYKTHNAKDKTNPYFLGDLVGKQGLEYKYENYLRGKRGFKLVQVNAFGRHNSDTLTYQTIEPIPGHHLELTIDWELQKIAKEAFRGKVGAVIALDPRNGDILAAVSSPEFDPEEMLVGITRERWGQLMSSPYKPMLDKTTGAEFPPGSVYKSVLAIAALQEKIVTPQTSVHCPGHYTLGNHTFRCWKRKGHGAVNLEKALVKSCDVYFYTVGMRLGVDLIARYARELGLGRRYNVNLNMERPGLVPTASWKQRRFKDIWRAGETPSISIGQGYNLMTPMQMAVLYSTIGNGGFVWKPHYIKRILDSQSGDTLFETKPTLIDVATDIDAEVFHQVQGYLESVVGGPGGTGHRAKVEGHSVAGKTGTVQVVSLKKYGKKAKSISMKWREHAMFGAFSPAHNPEIAVAVVSQNDKIGGGGKSAAPVAGKIIARYWELKKQRAENAEKKNRQ